MTDSIEKILAEMRELIRTMSDNILARGYLEDNLDRIEASMKEPVATLCLGCGETLESLAYRREHGDMRPCCPDSWQTDVYLLPPDQSKRIAELEKELAEAKQNAERYKYLKSKSFVRHAECPYWEMHVDMRDEGYPKWSPYYKGKPFKNMDEAIDAAISQEKENDK